MSADFEPLTENQLRDTLQRCNHAMAKALIIRKFAGGIIPQSLGALLSAYIDSPSAATARNLIEFDAREFVPLFQLSREGSDTESLFRSGDLSIETRTVESLWLEPEFEEYCSLVTEDPPRTRSNALKAQLR